MSIYGERLIAVQTYWQRGVLLLNQKGKCCMIHAPPFCCNVYIGTPWVLSHLKVVAVNKDPVVLCLVQLVLSSSWCWLVCVLSVSLCFSKSVYLMMWSLAL